jgi:hypothetical protein
MHTNPFFNSVVFAPIPFGTACRIGVSRLSVDVGTLGSHNSWGYGSTGKKSTGSMYTPYPANQVCYGSCCSVCTSSTFYCFVITACLVYLQLQARRFLLAEHMPTSSNKLLLGLLLANPLFCKLCCSANRAAALGQATKLHALLTSPQAPAASPASAMQ